VVNGLSLLDAGDAYKPLTEEIYVMVRPIDRGTSLPKCAKAANARCRSARFDLETYDRHAETLREELTLLRLNRHASEVARC
jgi:hypothetical protein